ncbi:hypothetical protein [Klebsiella pneumoniae]|uniref:hypothetical protein n=1 Tax=Klebsiella pneumoniae TaxID=573 RepID=UPI00385200F9
MPVSALICFCTCPDADSAERIATALVAEAPKKDEPAMPAGGGMGGMGGMDF